jgi:decaprenylphospho-beta-D-ribofuranose 2-oxidase
MRVSGWGNYPKIEAHMVRAGSTEKIKEFLNATDVFIPRGLGRSYGDSSLNNNILSTLNLNRMLSFDGKEGILSCESGVTLSEILEVFVPKGWFLTVTPGTKFVTVGGAIASDVHGKNHHKEGSFSDHLVSMDILTSEGARVTCSKTENAYLFEATCGGMGLTGIILNATFKMKRIETAYIRQTTIKTRNLEETMDYFENYGNFTYSVAWIDCLANKENLGRSILMLGEHAAFGDMKGETRNTLVLPKMKNINIPINFPNFVLNRLTAKYFNVLYYHKHSNTKSESMVDYDSFFYPLDSIYNWNRIYGSRGFTQYQCVLPYDMSKEGLKEILMRIRDSGMGSFLAVLKLFGKGNDNLLSFPMEGYTLALDFPISSGLFTFLEEMDRLVVNYGGRLYLSKDVRMGKDTFIKGYKYAKKFISAKKTIDKYNKLQSLQSKRLGL